MPSALIEPGPGFVLLSGENGAGKTNMLEAVSLLTPGPRPARRGAVGNGAAATGRAASRSRRKLGEIDIGTGTLRRRARTAAGADQRRAGVGQFASRMAVGAVADPGDGPAVHATAPATAAASSTGWCWRSSPATPTMPRATKRRCARATSCSPTPSCGRPGLARRAGSRRWPSMARRSPRRARRTVAALDERLAAAPDDDFPRAALALDGWDGGDLAAQLKANRARDAAAGRATDGPHRQDLAVTHRAKAHAGRALLDRRAEGAAARPRPRPCRAGRRAPRRSRRSCCSTRSPPISIPTRRAALFARLEGRGQVWMTATEAALVRRHRRAASRFHVEPGPIAPAYDGGLFQLLPLYCTATRDAFSSGVIGSRFGGTRPASRSSLLSYSRGVLFQPRSRPRLLRAAARISYWNYSFCHFTDLGLSQPLLDALAAQELFAGRRRSSARPSRPSSPAATCSASPRPAPARPRPSCCRRSTGSPPARNIPKPGQIRMLVLAPTRELAAQIAASAAGLRPASCSLSVGVDLRRRPQRQERARSVARASTCSSPRPAACSTSSTSARSTCASSKSSSSTRPTRCSTSASSMR